MNNESIDMCILARWGKNKEWDEIVDLQDVPLYVNKIELVVYCRGDLMYDKLINCDYEEQE